MRVGPQAVTLSCPSCQRAYPAELTNIINAESAPELKARLLSGGLNITHCPSCQATNPIVVPILYHDATKDLCVTHIPPELNLSADQQEKIVGELLNGLISSLPSENVRGYLFQPRSSLTLQNLREQILTADGYSSEEIQLQRAMNELLQKLLNASDATLGDVIHQEDDRISERFISTVSLLLEQMQRDKQADAEEQIQRLLDRLLETSTAGQRLKKQSELHLAAIKAIQTDIDALGENPSRHDIRKLALNYLNEDEIYLELLVSALRPALDYTFYQELTAALKGATQTEKDNLFKLREKLLGISARVDQIQKIALEQADALITEMLSAPNVTEAVRKHLPFIDQHFLHALGAQLADAEQTGNDEKTEALRFLQETVLAAIQGLMRPELKLLNELLEMDDFEAAQARLFDEGVATRDDLLSLMSELQPVMEKQGDTVRLEKLIDLRSALEKRTRTS